MRKAFDQIYERVFPQGLGTLLDGEQVFILDWDGSRYKRIDMDTIEGMGLQGAVEVFKKSLPTDLVGLASGWSKARLISVFESGAIKVEGEEVNLSVYEERAISA